jgi:hypothetical protein
MPVPSEQVLQLIADNLAMINKLTNQLKTEQDARAHAQRLFTKQTVINKRQAEINKNQGEIIKKQAQEISDQSLIIKKLRELLPKVKWS